MHNHVLNGYCQPSSVRKLRKAEFVRVAFHGSASILAFPLLIHFFDPRHREVLIPGFGVIPMLPVIMLVVLCCFFFTLVAFLLYRRKTRSELKRIISVIDNLTEHPVFSVDKLGKEPRTGSISVELERVIKSMRDDLNAIEKRLRILKAAINCLPFGIIRVDHSGRICEMNPAAISVLGAEKDFAIGKTIGQVVPAAGVEEMVRRARGGERATGEFHLFFPEEKRVFMQVYLLDEIRGEEGEILFVIEDVTALKRLEMIRREFVENVSHELRTPLANMSALIGALQSGGIEDKDIASRFLGKLEKEIAWMSIMVDDLLTLSRIESDISLPRREKIDLVSLLEDVVNEKRRLADEYNVTIDLKPYNGLTIFFADHDLLKRAVLNLVDNAIRYNVSGGRVYLKASIENEQLRITVEDTGIGIPEDEVERIFERFYRVDEARSKNTGGTGLGLSIVKHAAHVHGGKVEVESREGKGTIFTFEIPLASPS